MKSRLLLNIALLLLGAALVALIIYKPGLEQAPAPASLTTLDADEVHHLRIEREGSDAIELRREDQEWRLSGPGNLYADQGRIDSILRITQEKSATSYRVSAADSAKYGLKPPAVRLFLDEVELAFGATDPLSNRRYVRKGDNVYLTEDAYFHLLNAERASFVSPRLLPPKSEIVKITLPDKTLTQNAQGHWQLQPDAPTVSADDMQTLVDAWRNSSSLWVKAEEQAAAQGEVVIHLKQPEQELHFGIIKNENEVALVRKDVGMGYSLGADSAEHLLQFPAKSDASPKNAKPAAPATPAPSPP